MFFGTGSRPREADRVLMLSFASFDAFELLGFNIFEAEAIKVEALRLLLAPLSEEGVIGRAFGLLRGCCWAREARVDIMKLGEGGGVLFSEVSFPR